VDLLAKLQDDMKGALRAGDRERLGYVRLLINEVKNADLQPAKPTPQQAVEAYAKRLRKTAEEFERLGKPDEVAKLRAELAVAESYLPQKLTREQTEPLVDAFLATQSFTEKDVGRAQGAFLKTKPGDVDGQIVNQILRERLAGK